VIVPDYQLSLAIGKAGQNARLAAKLTNWKIDIKSESQAKDEGFSGDADEGSEDILSDIESDEPENSNAASPKNQEDVSDEGDK
jgi:N utilization substance protein A